MRDGCTNCAPCAVCGEDSDGLANELERVQAELETAIGVRDASMATTGRLRTALQQVRTRIMSLSMTTDRHHPSWSELQRLNHDITKALE